MFSIVSQRKMIHSSGREVILKSDRSLFGRMVVMRQSRKLDMMMKEMLTHPLGPLPWALATPDGFLRKTHKAVLVSALQKNVSNADKTANNSTTIIDGMSLVSRAEVAYLHLKT